MTPKVGLGFTRLPDCVLFIDEGFERFHSASSVPFHRKVEFPLYREFAWQEFW